MTPNDTSVAGGADAHPEPPPRTRCTDLFVWQRAVRGTLGRNVDVPDEDLLAPELRHTALTLSTWMDREGGGAHPSQVQLARAIGRDKSTVVRHLDRLEDLGWVLRRRGGGRGIATEYEATLPAHLDGRLVGDPPPSSAEPSREASDPPGNSRTGATVSGVETVARDPGNSRTGDVNSCTGATPPLPSSPHQNFNTPPTPPTPPARDDSDDEDQGRAGAADEEQQILDRATQILEQIRGYVSREAGTTEARRLIFEWERLRARRRNPHRPEQLLVRAWDACEQQGWGGASEILETLAGGLWESEPRNIAAVLYDRVKPWAADYRQPQVWPAPVPDLPTPEEERRAGELLATKYWPDDPNAKSEWKIGWVFSTAEDRETALALARTQLAGERRDQVHATVDDVASRLDARRCRCDGSGIFRDEQRREFICSATEHGAGEVTA